MVKVGLYVPLKAKPGKGDAVDEFLRSALPLVDAERDTVAWFAIRSGPETFAIFDVFPDEDGRKAHLSGPVADALMAKSSELFAEPPLIHELDIIASKLPA